MAKRRPPHSRHAALERACGILTYEAAAETVSKSETWLRRCSDPAEDREISLNDALLLDRALIDIGEEPSLFRWYSGQIETGGEINAETLLSGALYELRQVAVLIEARQMRGAELHAAGKAHAEVALQVAKLQQLIMDALNSEEGERQDAPSVRLVPRP